MVVQTKNALYLDGTVKSHIPPRPSSQSFYGPQFLIVFASEHPRTTLIFATTFIVDCWPWWTPDTDKPRHHSPHVLFGSRDRHQPARTGPRRSKPAESCSSHDSLRHRRCRRGGRSRRIQPLCVRFHARIIVGSANQPSLFSYLFKSHTNRWEDGVLALEAGW